MNRIIKAGLVALPIYLIFFMLSQNVFAQSPNDGFDPKLNDQVSTIMVQPDGKIIIGGAFTTISGVTRNRIARIYSNGSLDMSFDAGTGANNIVHASALQPDGMILVGGEFTSINDITRNHIARLNSDGSLATGFDPNADGIVKAITLQADGKILIGGSFTTIGGVARNRIARLNADGSLDTGFDPNISGIGVYSITIQSDGKILVGGSFTMVSSVVRNHIARLNADGGLDTGFDPNANNPVCSIVLQPDGKILIGGQFTAVGGWTRNHFARLNSDGCLDFAFALDVNDEICVIALQPDGKILIGGNFSNVNWWTPRYRIARANSNGSHDYPFGISVNSTVKTIIVQPDGNILIGGGFSEVGGRTRKGIARLYNSSSLDAHWNPGPNGTIYTAVTQPDGKTIVSGRFSRQVNYSLYENIARFNDDSSVDGYFYNPEVKGSVYALAVQPNGKVLIAGAFTSVYGLSHNNIARLESYSYPDATFNPNVNGEIYSVILQPDGKILIGGSFTAVNGVTRNYIARLNSNGSLDTTFDPAVSDIVNSVAVQADGKVLIGGYFTAVDGMTRIGIARLNKDGSVDTTFDPVAGNPVFSIAVQADGKILIGGNFTTIGSVVRNYFVRLNNNGTLDTTFDPDVNNVVRTISIQLDGRILIGGAFTAIGGIVRNYIARLNSDGGLDAGFDPDANDSVYSISLQPDGKIIIGGEFTMVDGISRNNLARLRNSGAALQEIKLSNNNSVIQWIRQGTGPEIMQVWFEQSMDGSIWKSIGNGSRINNGWQVSSDKLPVNTQFYVRARGIVQGGDCNGSSTIIESIKGFYISLPVEFESDETKITINNGAPITSKTAIGLTLNMSGAAKMRFMADTKTWTAWEAYSTAKAIILPAGDGVKAVYVQFDNGPDIYYDTIILDTKPPVGTVVINNGDYITTSQNVTLALTATDVSTVTDMCISTTTTCSAWESFNTTKTFTLAGTADAYGIKTVYVKFKDSEGKISSLVSDTIIYAATPLPSYTPGAISISANASGIVSKPSIYLYITKPDSSYTHMAFSNDKATWTAWELVKSLKFYTLPAGDGYKVVYVKFKKATNMESIVYGDGVILDTKPPVGKVTINNGAITTNTRAVTLQLDAADVNGVSYVLYYDGIYWTWKPYAKTIVFTLPAGDGIKKVSVKFKDSAGNESAIISDTIILDTKPPVGKVTINAGAATTSSDLVTLTLSAPTSVFMQISLDGGTTWGTWEPFVTSKQVTLPSGAGTKTVQAVFSDFAGNVSTVATDTITRNP